MITSFKEYAKLREAADGMNIVTNLRNTLANARWEPYQVLGDGLKSTLQAAEQQGDQGAVQLVMSLQDLTMSFFQRIRNYMRNPMTGNGVSPAVAPKDESDPNFQPFQQEWLRFSKQFSDKLTQYQQQQQQGPQSIPMGVQSPGIQPGQPAAAMRGI